MRYVTFNIVRNIILVYVVLGFMSFLGDKYFQFSPPMLSDLFSPTITLFGLVSIFVAGFFPSLLKGSELTLYSFSPLGDMIIFLVSFGLIVLFLIALKKLLAKINR